VWETMKPLPIVIYHRSNNRETLSWRLGSGSV